MFRHYCNVLCLDRSLFDFELARYSIFSKFTSVHPLHVKDADAALDAIEVWNFRPSLLVVDPELPGQNGPKLIGRLKLAFSAARAPLVVFSRNDCQQQWQKCLNAGADAWFAKPESLEDYQETVQTIIRRWTTRQRCPIPEVSQEHRNQLADRNIRRELIACGHSTGRHRHSATSTVPPTDNSDSWESVRAIIA